jgi:hypothetical protein
LHHSRTTNPKRARFRIAISVVAVGAAFGFSLSLPGQTPTTINLGTQGRNADFSMLPVTRPVTVGTTLPATCLVGQLFFNSAAPAGLNLYACASVNNWTQLAGGGGGANPQVSLDRSSLSFGGQTITTKSGSQVVTLTDSGTSFLTVTSIGLAGANAADFATSNSCPATVPSGASCTISVSFTPSIVGVEAATLSIVDSAAGSPHTISLTGTGQNLITSGGLTVNPSATHSQIGATTTFSSNRPVTWSLVSGSSGTLNVSDDMHATYTAPASIQNQNVLAGCPVLPNDSVFNTRIDGLPVNANSANWTSPANTGTNGLSFDTGWGTSIVDNTVPLTNEVFYYTGQYNGSWLLPSLPQLKREMGTFVSDQNGSDHHILAVNKDNCQFWEVYNNYLAPRPVNGVTYTGTSGYSYNGLSYGLPANGTTDAAGLPLGPLTLHLDEVKNLAVHHAVRFTLAGGFVYGNSNFIYWPATQPHYANCCTNSPPYGARFRLKSSFDLSKFSPMAKAILTGLQQYGMILADAGTGPTITVDTDLSRDPSAAAALGQIAATHITLANFEAVDESSLMVNAKSSQVNPANPYVQAAAFAVVNATDQSNSNFQVNYPLALQGVNIGLTDPILYVAAGSYNVQLTCWVTGSSNQNVTWSQISGVGSVTPDGVYTPPSSVSGPSGAVLVATSAADRNAVAYQYITVIPTGNNPAPGTIRINSGGPQATDKNGNIWLADQGFEAGDYTQLNGDYPSWPAQSNPEIGIYESAANTYGSDVVYRFVVPNGNYKVRFMFGQLYDGAFTSSGCTFGVKLHAPLMVEAQGVIAAHNYDFGKSINYNCATPVDVYVPAQVTDNRLTAALRLVVPDGQQGNSAPEINGFEIIPDSTAPFITIDTQQQATVNAGTTLQLYAVGWYMNNAVSWSISGSGAISQTGLYTAPTSAPASPATVTATATSTVDATITATATLTIP